MARLGRELEEVVAAIEKALGGEAEVISPYRVKDKDTGQPREIDVAIRRSGKTSPILLIVECRDRKKPEDVRWIEEIDSKKRSVGAVKAIAVSSSEFTEPATLKAKALGIDLRQTKDLTQTEIQAWIGKLTIETTHQRSQLKEVTVFILDPRGQHRENSEKNKALAGPIEKFRFLHMPTQSKLSIFQIWKEISPQHPFWRDVPLDGKRVFKTAPARFPHPESGLHLLLENQETIAVAGIDFHAECWHEIQEGPFSKGVAYSDAKEKSALSHLASAFEAKMPIEGTPTKISLIMGAAKEVKGLIVHGKKTRPNDPCPCANGRKFKRCCGKEI